MRQHLTTAAILYANFTLPLSSFTTHSLKQTALVRSKAKKQLRVNHVRMQGGGGNGNKGLRGVGGWDFTCMQKCTENEYSKGGSKERTPATFNPKVMTEPKTSDNCFNHHWHAL